MEKQVLLDKTKLEEETEPSPITSISAMEIILIDIFDMVFNCDKNQNLKEKDNIKEKLSIFEFLLNIEEIPNKNEYFENFKYKKDDKKLEYFDKDFTSRKRVINLEDEKIDEIKEIISITNKNSQKFQMRYLIIIKGEKQELDIYLGINKKLCKYLFKIKNLQSFSNEISQHCNKEKIKFYIKKPFKKNKITDSLCSIFFDMIKNHEKTNTFQFFDEILPNYIRFEVDNYSSISSDSSDLFDNRNKIPFIPEIKIKEISLDCEGDQKELKIFIMNLMIFQEKNYNNSSYMVVLEKKEEFPVIYVQINLEIFKITIKRPGLSLHNFCIFCEKKAHITIYIKKNGN